MKIIEQLDLFTEPKKKKEQRNYNFDITLQDGGAVNVKYQNPCFGDYPHLDFRGNDISETGYFSLFPQWNIYSDDTLDKIKEIAIEIAEKLHTDLIIKKQRQMRKKHRRG